MTSVQKLITYIALLPLIFTQYGQFLFAQEELYHSLDELPSMQLTVPVAEEASADISSDFANVLAEKKQFAEKMPVSISASALLEERESYIAKAVMSMVPTDTPTLAPQFIINPLSPAAFSRTAITEGFFSGYKKNEDARKRGKQRKEKQVASTKGSISVEMPIDMTVMTADGTPIDMAVLDISTLDEEKKNKAKKQFEKNIKYKGNLKKGKTEAAPEGFDFGIPGTHLIFSQPVALTIDMPYATDGIIVDIMTEHAGDKEFHTRGLSVDADTTCNTDGTASKPGNQAVVKDGKVTFYTCGASSFTMNPSGGATGSNDLRLVIGDCGQVQIYYNGQQNIYTGTPPATGCNTSLDSWIALRIGNTTYWNNANNWTSNGTVGNTVGNTYTATTTLVRRVSGRDYTLVLNWSHTAPEKFFNIDYSLTIPTGNTNNVKLFIANDSMVAGNDAFDVGYSGSTVNRIFGVYDNNSDQLSALEHISGPIWDFAEVSGYNTIYTRVNGGTNFNNTVASTAGDWGFGVNWDFGTTPKTITGSLQWRVLPFSTANVVDLIPGIGQPEGPLTTGFISELPIRITNAGNLTSSGIHTVVLTIPTNISGPTSAFTNNGWSCGSQVGTTVTCTKTTTIASLDYDTVNIPVIPQPAAAGSSVTFNIALSNPGDSNTSNNTAFATNAVVAGAPVFSPGGVSSPTLWLKANEGSSCTTDACTLTAWNDQSGNSRNFSTLAGTPQYLTNTLNYNPTIGFDGASSLSRLGSLNIGTTYIVYRHTSTRVWENPFTSDNGAGIFHGNNDTLLYSATWTPATTQGGTSYLNGLNIPTMSMVRPLTYGLQTRVLTANDTSNSTYFIGRDRTFADRSITGNIAEIITYAGIPTSANRNKVESYLGLKYGISLDQTSATNYTLSDNSVIWNSSLAGAYKQNITGIGRDDTSKLNQIKSQNIDNTNDIIVGASSAIGVNYRALTWANDGTNTATMTTTDIPSGFARISREWQFQEKNGDVGNVKIQYPVSALPIGAGSPLYLFTDTDGTFATGSTIYTGSLVGSNWEWTINPTDMLYITFGQGGDTTPPTIASATIASGTLIPHGNFTLSYAYSDVGTGISPSTATGRIYAWNSGTSSYNATPLSGYMTLSSSNSSSATMNIANLPFGRYRFDMSISDNTGNSTTRSFTYFVDAIEWTISADTYTIGNIVQNVATFGSGELLITVKTVGAGFSLSTSPTSALSLPSGDTINYWNGSFGVGYDIWSGSAFGGTILAYSPNATLATVGKNINQDGLKNTFTYRVKYGAQVDFMQKAGDYSGIVNFGLSLDY